MTCFCSALKIAFYPGSCLLNVAESALDYRYSVVHPNESSVDLVEPIVNFIKSV